VGRPGKPTRLQAQRRNERRGKGSPTSPLYGVSRIQERVSHPPESASRLGPQRQFPPEGFAPTRPLVVPFLHRRDHGPDAHHPFALSADKPSPPGVTERAWCSPGLRSPVRGLAWRLHEATSRITPGPSCRPTPRARWKGSVVFMAMRNAKDIWIRRCSKCRTEDHEHSWETPQDAMIEPPRSIVMRLQRRGSWRCAACGTREYEVMPTPER
jgi:hypothetical protein